MIFVIEDLMEGCTVVQHLHALGIIVENVASADLT